MRRILPSCIVVALFTAASAYATAIHWNNATGGNWSSASNWSPAQVPAGTDDVFLDFPGTYTVTLDVTTAPNSLTIGGGASGLQTFTIGTAGPPVLTTSITVATNGKLSLSNGTIAGGPFLVNGAMSWTNGNINGPGALTIAGGASLTIDTNGAKGIATTLNNLGTVTWINGTINLYAGSSINNQSGALFDLQGAVSTFGGQTFTNAGTLRKSVSTGTATIDSPLTNGGTVDAESGTLSLTGGGTENGAFNAAAGAQIGFYGNYTINGGSFTGAGTYSLVGTTFVVAASVSIPNLVVGSTSNNATVDGAGTLTVTSSLTLVDSVLQGNGATTIPLGATLTISGPANSMTARTLNIAGSALWTGGSVTGAPVINVQSGGVLEIRSDQSMGAGTITNLGTIRKTTTAGTTLLGVTTFNSSGTVDVETGTLAIGGSGTGSGTFNTAAGATLSFQNSSATALSYTMNGATFTGTGVVNDANDVIFATDTTVPSLSITNAGVVEGAANLTITTSLDWDYGYMKGSGTTTVATGATAALHGSYATIDTRTLNIAGSLVWSNGTISLTNATLNNLAGATFEARCDQTLGGTGSFNNAGVFRKTTTTGTTVIGSGGIYGGASTGAFNNSGTVDVQTGVLTPIGGGTESGTFTTASGSMVRFLNATFTFSGGSFSGPGTMYLDGSVAVVTGSFQVQNLLVALSIIDGSGNMTVTGSASWYRGGMRGTGVTTLASGASMVIDGTPNSQPPYADIFDMDTRTFNVAGNVQWLTGLWTMKNGAAVNIQSGGVFEVRCDQPINPVSGSTSPGVINNAGIIRKLMTGGTTTMAAGSISNSGTIDLQSGILAVTGGAFTQGAGAQLMIKFSGSTAGAGFGQLQSAGSATLAGGLVLTFVNGFVPLSTATFPIITYASHSGTFATVSAPVIPADPFTVAYNAANVSVLITNADLSITGTASPNPVLHGGTLTYNYTIANNGPSNATAVSVSDALPTGATLTSASVGQGSCVGTAPVVCTIGSLAKGASTTMTLVVTAPSTSGALRNVAVVVANEPDSLPADDTVVTSSADIGSATDVAVTAISPPNPHHGGITTLTISGQNFHSDAMVWLNRGTYDLPDPGPVYGKITAFTSSSITATFDLSSPDDFGDFDVVVMNGDGTTASLHVGIVPTILWPYSEFTGEAGISVGTFQTNYMETLGGGNGDGIAILELSPPLPGIIQLKVGDQTNPTWDSSTDPDPAHAIILQPLTQAVKSQLPLTMMIPPANVKFSEEPPLLHAELDVPTEPLQVSLGDNTLIVWDGVEMGKDWIKGKILDKLVDPKGCAELGTYLSPQNGVSKDDLQSAIDTAVNAIDPKNGSTMGSVLEEVGSQLGSKIPGWDQVAFGAKVGHCFAAFLIAMQEAYFADVKRLADNLRHQNPNLQRSINGGGMDIQLSIALDEISRSQGGKNGFAGAQHVIDLRNALMHPPCYKPGIGRRAALKARINGPHDPNDKTTVAPAKCQTVSPTSATCAQYFTPPNTPIDYTIEFENDKSATAPANNIVVTDVLDPSLDPSTVTMLSNSSPGTFSMSTSAQTLTFTFTGINLPPDTNPPAGQGYVRFSVNQRPNVTLGTLIHNTASIVFNANPPIATPDVVYAVSNDVDNDGILDRVEDGAPDNGDGNGDGIPDRLQANVTSFPAPAGAGSYITIAVSGGCNQIQSAAFASKSGQRQDDPGYDYPGGLVSFTLPCASAQVTVYYHGITGSLTNTQVRRFGPATPGDPSTEMWYTQPGATIGTAVIGGATVPTMSFSVTDGAVGDDGPQDDLITGIAGLGNTAANLAFSAYGYSIARNTGGNATITVNRLNASAGAVAVSYTTANGSAVAGTDYTTTSGTLSWADGDATAKTFTIPVVAAGSQAGNLTIGLVLSNPTGGAELGTPRQAVLNLIGGVKGDVNGDGAITGADIFYLINNIFGGGPTPFGSADVNGDGVVNAADVFYLIKYLFAGGPAPK